MKKMTKEIGISNKRNGPAAAHGSSLVQLCTFYLDGLLFGVGVEQVQEVIRYQEMTPVPLAPSAIRGLINLRGQIVTAIDLRRRLELPDGDSGRLPMNVVIRTADGLVSLLVDEIGDVIDVDSDSCHDPPMTLSGAARELIRGAYPLPGRLLLALDVDKTMAIEAA
jgi:purine-binding chemotaxis protein CheW